MDKIKVVYILNHAPNYRDVFLRELGKYVDLTVVSFSGAPIKLKDPDQRTGYKFIELKQKMIFGISYQVKEFTTLTGDYDVLIIGFDTHRPLRFLNLLRNKRVIFAGLIYGRNQRSFMTKIVRKSILSHAEGVLVYSEFVKERLSQEISKPIISFNNTSFNMNDIQPLPFNFKEGELNLIWVGRYKKIKKIESLIELARKYPNINLRLIGPSLEENILLNEADRNISIFPEVYESDLIEHFKWSDAVFSPGHIGLFVMNVARYGRPIFIDSKTRHAPEVQLAKDAGQIFLDFEDKCEVDNLIKRCLTDREYLVKQGARFANVMKGKYTVEYMAQQFLKAIEGKWDN